MSYIICFSRCMMLTCNQVIWDYFVSEIRLTIFTCLQQISFLTAMNVLTTLGLKVVAIITNTAVNHSIDCQIQRPGGMKLQWYHICFISSLFVLNFITIIRENQGWLASPDARADVAMLVLPGSYRLAAISPTHTSLKLLNSNCYYSITF